MQPFRFLAAALTAPSAEAWAENARRIEDLGYWALAVGDHFTDIFGPIPALTAAADATTNLRLVSGVFVNDFRHPAVLAKDAATVDVLSSGRLVLGIGAGWRKQEFDQIGVPFAEPALRVSRVEEAVQVIKGLWGDEPLSFSGEHYSISDLDGLPKPLQRPHPPIFIGSGGRRLLSFAAREADIVDVTLRAQPAGGVDIGQATEESLSEKVAWVKEAAGDRFTSLELNMLIFKTIITDNPTSAAEEIAGMPLSATERYRKDRPRSAALTPELILASPHFQIGSVQQMVENLHALREQYGVSSFAIYPEDVEPAAPIVAQLGGT